MINVLFGPIQDFILVNPSTPLIKHKQLKKLCRKNPGLQTK